MPQVTLTHKNGGFLPQIRSLALVAIGSNQPFGESDVRETLRKAIECIAEEVGVIRAQSRFFRTAAFPAGSGPDFLNAALAIQSDLDPAALLQALHQIEERFGRDRNQRWAPRTLDLDLVAFGEKVLPNRETFREWANLPLETQMKTAPDGLVLPHPRLHERAFVLIPLADVAPDWVHPVLGQSVQEMCAGLSPEQKGEVHIA